jgi:hypothetical protein
MREQTIVPCTCASGKIIDSVVITIVNTKITRSQDLASGNAVKVSRVEKKQPFFTLKLLIR